MVEPSPQLDPHRRWPALRRFAWTALFVAMLGWSSMLNPAPPPEVLLWDVTVPA